LIEIVLGVLQRFMLQGGTVLLVGATTWLVVMPGALQRGYAESARATEGPAIARELDRRVHRMALRIALVVVAGWALRLPVQLMGFRDPFVPLREDLRILLLETVWGSVFIGQGIILIFLLTALFAVAAMKSVAESGASPASAPRKAPRRAAPPPASPPSAGSAAVFPLIVATGLVGLSLSLSSHALSADNPRIALVADLVHATAAGVWIGLLTIILLLSRGAGARSVTGDAFILQIRRFSASSLVAVPLLIVAGVLLGQYHLGAVADLWQTTYGRVLSAKVLLAVTAMGLGFLNWRRGVPLLEDPGVRAALRRRAGVEIGVALGVLLLTAILTGTSR
jgi:putative copper export protein